MKKSIYQEPWDLYILECADKTLYIGIAKNAKKREKEHNSTNKCKYTRVRKPVKIVYKEKHKNHHEASKRELALKKLTRAQKKQLIKEAKRDQITKKADFHIKI